MQFIPHSMPRFKSNNTWPFFWFDWNIKKRNLLGDSTFVNNDLNLTSKKGDIDINNLIHEYHYLAKKNPFSEHHSSLGSKMPLASQTLFTLLRPLREKRTVPHCIKRKIFKWIEYKFFPLQRFFCHSYFITTS